MREKGQWIGFGDLSNEEFIEILKEASKRNRYKKIMKSDARLVEERKL